MQGGIRGVFQTPMCGVIGLAGKGENRNNAMPAKNDLAIGFHAVSVLLKTAPQRVATLKIARGRHDQRMQKLLALCTKQNIAPIHVERDVLDRLCGDAQHQGVLAEVLPGKSFSEKELYALIESSPDALILVLDGVTDPHNLGACLRSADAAGVLAVVVPKDNSATLTEVARKVASGAAETVPLIAVTNLARALKHMQEIGVWITGTAGEAETVLYNADLRGARAIVLGAEGNGMRRLTKEYCDDLVNIPMLGEVSSLNVSVACGVLLFEALRQRNYSQPR